MHISTVMRHLTVGILFEKCIIRRCRRFGTSWSVLTRT